MSLSLEPIHYITILLGVTVVVLLWLVLSRGGEGQRQPVSEVRSEAVGSAGVADQKPALLYFYSDVCPHAVRMTPEWEKAAAALGGRLHVEKYLPDTEEFKQAIPYTNGATPSVLYAPGDGAEPIVYSGDRSAESLIRFATSGGQNS